MTLPAVSTFRICVPLVTHTPLTTVAIQFLSPHTRNVCILNIIKMKVTFKLPVKSIHTFYAVERNSGAGKSETTIKITLKR